MQHNVIMQHIKGRRTSEARLREYSLPVEVAYAALRAPVRVCMLHALARLAVVRSHMEELPAKHAHAYLRTATRFVLCCL